MVGVDNHSRVLQLRVPGVQVADQQNVLIVVVGMGLALLVHIAPQDSVGIGIALRVDLPAPVNEGVLILGGGDGVHHHGEAAGGGVLHAHGHLNAAGGEPVLLVLHRAGTHGHIGQDIVQILIILGIEHLVGTGEAGLLHHTHMQFPDGNQALEHIRLILRVRLMQHPFVALAGGTGLVGIAAGDNKNLILHLLLHPAQPLHIVQHAVRMVGRAGANDQQQPLVPAGEDILQLDIPLFKAAGHLPGKGVHLLHLGRDGQLAYKFHVHRAFLLGQKVEAIICPRTKNVNFIPQISGTPTY